MRPIATDPNAIAASISRVAPGDCSAEFSVFLIAHGIGASNLAKDISTFSNSSASVAILASEKRSSIVDTTAAAVVTAIFDLFHWRQPSWIDLQAQYDLRAHRAKISELRITWQRQRCRSDQKQEQQKTAALLTIRRLQKVIHAGLTPIQSTCDEIRPVQLGASQQQRSAPGDRPGLSRLSRFQRRGRGARLSVEFSGRASFHRLEPGFGDVDALDGGSPCAPRRCGSARR